MNMQKDPNDTMIVKATVELGKNLGLQVVAEGVEDRESYDDLAEMGCDLAQGYLISRPIPASEATRWLEQYAVRSRSGDGDDGRPQLHVV